MSKITVVLAGPVDVSGEIVGGKVWIDRNDLSRATGWERKPEGLCQGDLCIPVRDSNGLEDGERIDLVRLSEIVGRRVVVDDTGIVALSNDGGIRRAALEGLVAPEFTLPDLNGNDVAFSSFAGSKRVLVTFSSWCGCRYDLPGWQELADELSTAGLVVIAVALDDDPEAVRPFTNGISFPVLLDRQHLLSELYAISNVPTVVWIDEAGTIVRPNGLIFGTDTFADFTGVDSSPDLELLRRWVIEGVSPMAPNDAAGAIGDLSDVEIDARLHFRVGVEAKRRGRELVAQQHLRRASELTPMDFSVRRAAMPLLGEDPFGNAFLDLYDEWQAQGAPYHGLPVEKGR